MAIHCGYALWFRGNLNLWNLHIQGEIIAIFMCLLSEYILAVFMC